MKQRLMIGGPADGERFGVADTATEIVVPHYEEFESPLSGQPIVESIPEKRTIYSLNRIRGSKTTFEVFAPSGWDGDQIVSALIRGYKEENR